MPFDPWGRITGDGNQAFNRAVVVQRGVEHMRRNSNHRRVASGFGRKAACGVRPV
jgi:hypothetical protein